MSRGEEKTNPYESPVVIDSPPKKQLAPNDGWDQHFWRLVFATLAGVYLGVAFWSMSVLNSLSSVVAGAFFSLIWFTVASYSDK
jgi:hypothetical protein